nr:MAG TPA: hypothetical protein [Bacteriophage sp.]
MTKQSAAFAVPNRILASTDAMIWTAMNMRRSAKITLRRKKHDYILIRIHPWSHIRSGWPCMCSDHVRQAPPGRLERSNGMLTRNKKLKDYGIPAEDIEKLNTMLKDFPAEYEYLLSSAALSACPKNTVIADMVIENILHRKSYRKISKERYIPMNPKDFYGYRRKTVAVLYERMRLLGVWEEK